MYFVCLFNTFTYTLTYTSTYPLTHTLTYTLYVYLIHSHLHWHTHWHTHWHILSNTFTNTLTYTLTHTLTYTLYVYLFHSHTHWHIHWHTHWHIHWHTHWRIHSDTHWHIHWHTHDTYTLTHTLTYTLTHTFTYTLTHTLTYTKTHTHLTYVYLIHWHTHWHILYKSIQTSTQALKYTSNPTWGDIWVSSFKAQSSNLERRFSLKRGKSDVRASSFEFWHRNRKFHPRWDRVYIDMRGGGLGSRPKKMYGKRLGDEVEYHLMSPTPRC